MKRAVAVILALLLVSGIIAVASADSDVAIYVEGQGYRPTAAAGDSGASYCDFIINSATEATMEWSEGTQMYTVRATPDEIAGLYPAALELGDWDSCRYVVDGLARVSYGCSSETECSTLSEYARESRKAFDARAGFPAEATDPTASGDEQAATQVNYVLNKNTLKFHWPDCPSVKQMKPENQWFFTGTRDEVLSMGYGPCGNCNP